MTFDEEVLKSARERLADYMNDSRSRYQASAKEYGSTTITILFLLNGGAIVAVLAFFGSIFSGATGSKFDVVISSAAYFGDAMWLFCLGLIFCAVTSGMSYFNFMAGSNSHIDLWHLYLIIKDGTIVFPKKKWGILTEILLWLGVLSAISSLVCFLIGAFNAATAMRILGA